MANIIGKDNYEIMPQVGGVDIVPSGGATGQVLVKINGTDYNYSWETPAAGSTSVFGQNYAYGASDALSTTTSTLYQQKLRVVTPSLPSGGTYRMTASCVIGCDDGAAGHWRVQIDDSIDVVISDSNDNSTPGNQSATTVWSGALTSGTHNIDMDWTTVAGTTSILYARIEFWRVS